MKHLKQRAKRIAAAAVAIVMASQMAITAIAAGQSANTAEPLAAAKQLKLWYDEPAPSSDIGWREWSIPMGNGYMGVNLFGGVQTERIQITENSLQDSNTSVGGLNNFSETYIDFEHSDPQNYQRELNLSEGVASVVYDSDGVRYERQYFTDYPDKVMVIRLSASEAGKLSFTLRPTIPYLCDYHVEPGDNRGKHGTVKAEGDTITLAGAMEYYNVEFEGQYKVLPTGGTMTAQNDENGDNGTISVQNADSAVILIGIGTNYELKSSVFTANNRLDKLKGNAHPHAKVTKIIQDASAKSYDELLASHQEDYKGLFDRVSVDFGGQMPTVTTDELLKNYQNGQSDPYLEELFYQFGRYMLICSSRKGALPPNLQGVWNVFNDPPWRSGYWHNINLQMNYWPAFTGNLPELFEAYADYQKAYLEKAEQYAVSNIQKNNPSALDKVNTKENGWALGNSTWPYNISGSASHSGFGTGAFTSIMFWDYYDYTRDASVLEDTAYPAVSGMAKFLSKIVQPIDGYLLASPSYSPENQHDGGSYKTVGCAFDQQMIYENHLDTLKAADALGLTAEDEPALATLEQQLPLLDPVQVGASGQIKEYREEKFYGDIGEYDHRHISQLVGAYPGTMINSSTPAWLDAVKVSLQNRGDGSKGWSKAHRTAVWARVFEGDEAYRTYQLQLRTHTMNNLFNDHNGSKNSSSKLFQCDGNFGATAGVSEMLLQSHEGFLAPLPAMPQAWDTGSYRGLLARGNFEVSADWAEGQATKFEILSKSGESCKVKYDNLASAKLTDSQGNEVLFTTEGKDIVCFDTKEGETYTFTQIPEKVQIDAPTNLTANYTGADAVELSWDASANASGYNVYRATGSEAEYELIAADVSDTSYRFESPDLEINPQTTFRITAVSSDGHESKSLTRVVLQTAQPESATAAVVGESNLQISIAPVEEATSYRVYQKTGEDSYELVLESAYSTVVLENAALDCEYAVTAFNHRESAKTPVVITSNFDVDNALLNKPITINRSTSGSYPASLAVDGDNSTRLASSDANIGTPLVLEIDLQGSYSLNHLTFKEFIPSSEKKTRCDETTVELLQEDGSWKTVVDKQSLTTPKSGAVTAFDLGGVSGSKMRITIVNKETRKGPTLFEIQCSASVAKPADKTALFHAVTDSDTVDTAGALPIFVSAFEKAKADAVTALTNLTASQSQVDAAITALEQAIQNLKSSGENILLNKPITVDQPPYSEQYPATNLVDGDLSTRFAAKDDGNSLTVEIDLQGRFKIDLIYLQEYINPDTRSHKTTIEVFDNNEWTTAVQNLELSSESIDYRRSENLIDLGGVEGSKIRFHFLNTKADKRITIYEINAIGTNLTPPEPVDTDKTILNKVIEKAEALLGTDEFNNAIQSVQDSFQAALAQAKDVADYDYSTQEEIDAAWVSLMTEIHKLGLQQGNKDLLREHVELYSQLDLDLYIDGDAKDNFVAALEAAKAMLENNDAVQSEVDAADDALVAAAQALVKRGDKTTLQSVVDSTANYVEDHYAKGWAEFAAARDAANAVLENPNATQEEIDAATDALIEAMLNLRLKADKSLLNAVIAAAEGLDLSGYTRASVEAFEAALNEAKATAADESLSVDEQNQVTEAVYRLSEAVNNLKKADGSAANLSVNGDGSITGGSGSAKTGEATPIAMAMAALLLAGSAIVLKKRR